MIDLHLRADVAGGGREAGQAGEDVGHERGVQIEDRPQGVERALGQRPFGAGPGRRGALAGQRADEVHEQLGQLLVMDRAVDGQRADAGRGVGRVVAPAEEHRADGDVQRLARPGWPGPGACPARRRSGPSGRAGRAGSGGSAGSCSACRRPAGDGPSRRRSRCPPRPRPGGAAASAAVNSSNSVTRSTMGAGLLGGQRLEVGEEVVRPRQVGLGLLVQAAVDRVVGALEQPRLAVDRELVARRPAGPGGSAPSRAAGTTTEAVMSSSVCTLSAATKSWRSLNVRQACERQQADAQVGADELAAERLQLVAGEAVDAVHAEHARASRPMHSRRDEPLDDEDDRVDVVRERRQPGVVLVGVVLARA